MPRMARCGLIQAKNERTPGHAPEARKNAMVDADRRPETDVRLMEIAP